MTIKNEYELKQLVYLKTDPDQCVRIIISIHISVQGITYVLSCGDECSEHFAFEISKSKNYSLTIDNE